MRKCIAVLFVVSAILTSAVLAQDPGQNKQQPQAQPIGPETFCYVVVKIKGPSAWGAKSTLDAIKLTYREVKFIDSDGAGTYPWLESLLGKEDKGAQKEFYDTENGVLTLPLVRDTRGQEHYLGGAQRHSPTKTGKVPVANNPKVVLLVICKSGGMSERAAKDLVATVELSGGTSYLYDANDEEVQKGLAMGLGKDYLNSKDHGKGYTYVPMEEVEGKLVKPLGKQNFVLVSSDNGESSREKLHRGGGFRANSKDRQRAHEGLQPTRAPSVFRSTLIVSRFHSHPFRSSL